MVNFRKKNEKIEKDFRNGDDDQNPNIAPNAKSGNPGGGGEVVPSNGLLGMYRWMGCHF